MSSINLDPISLAVFGLAALLLGLVELLLSRVRRLPPGKAALSLASLFVAGAGAAFASGQSVVVWQAALGLAAVELVLALLRAPLPFALLGKPAAQGAALAVAAAVLLGVQLHRIDSQFEQELSRSDSELSRMIDPIAPNAQPVLTVQTDAGQPVPLFAVAPDSHVAAEAEARFLSSQRLELKLIQTGSADIQYNCHGWVFTGGRYWVRSAMVDGILKDNGYVSQSKPQPGDVAVFRDPSGQVSHTGLVRSAGGDGPVLIESKWGRLGRFIHTADDHGYRGHGLTFYHSPRGSHLLRGVDDSRGQEPAALHAGI